MQRMKELIEKVVKGYGDYIAMVLGSITLILSFVFDAEELWLRILIFLSGFIGFMYAACALYYLIKKRPLFDWYLLHGHFLRKVCCLVMLMPSSLAVISVWAKIEPKMLTYEEALYECGDKQLPCDIKREQESPNIFWSTYYHFIDPGNQHMTTTQWGRCWAAIVAILGILLLNGLLVSSLIGWFDNRKEKWLNGKVKYPCFLRKTPHYVIVGGNDMVAGIVMQLFTQSSKDDSKKEAADDNADKELADDNSDKESAEDNADKESADVNADKELPYILIQTSRDVDSFRRELFSNLKVEQQQRVIIYYGNRTSTDDIKDLILESAEEVYILGEDTRTDDIESYHDTMNMKCLELVRDYYKLTQKGNDIDILQADINNKGDEITASKDDEQKKELKDEKEKLEKELHAKQLKCRVMFEYQTTFSVFQFYDLDKDTSKYICFKPFNYYEMWAQRILVNQEINETKLKCLYENGKYLPLEGYKGIKKGDNDYVHLFIVGISRMGMAMAIEAAHLAHYPNYTEEKKIRTKITFIDKNAKEEKDFFMGRFKELFALSHWRYGALDENSKLVWLKKHIPDGYEYLGGDFLDIEWEFINGGIGQTSIQDYILSSATPSARVTIAICLPESNRSHAAALYLHKKIYESDSVLQVLVYNRYGNSIIQALQSKERVFPYLNKIKSFGEPRECLSTRFLQQSENIGAAIGGKYEDIRQKYILKALEKAGQQEGKRGYNGKSSTAKSWSDVYNGITMWTKLRSIYYMGILTSIQIKILSNVEHNRWNIEQLLMNFRPLTKQEQDDVINKKRDKEDLKKQMAHLNICSNKRLDELKDVDVAARAYDKGLTELIPKILKDIKCQTNK